MVWHNKYWDALDNLYWTPKHLGLKSIGKSNWGEDPRLIQFPRSLVGKAGTIYTREGTYASNAERMRALEETLNHVFDLTFGIVADEVIATLLHKAAGIDDTGPFERLGREAGSRYGWRGNVTQHDGFFVSRSSILCVELKLGSKTSPEQVFKYIAMISAEEARGQRSEVALLYVTPQEAPAIWQQAGADPSGHLPADFVEVHANGLKVRLEQIYDNNRRGIEDVARRLRLAHLTWSELLDACEKFARGLDCRQAGDQTLSRLLEGFVAAVREHRGTGCSRAGSETGAA